MTHLYATDKLKNRRKDYRKFHRKYLKYLREEHSDRNTMYRFMFRLPYKTQQQVADELGVSRKTIARHNDDIPYSDWLTLTGVYAQVKRTPDDEYFGEYSDMVDQIKNIFPKL